jgi:RES domain-containing protein
MEIYRITLAKYADSLIASGRAARWNSKGRQVIYAAESRSLACLENLVHRSGLALQQDFRTLVISVPDSCVTEVVHLNGLPDDWRSLMDLSPCQRIGDSWLSEQRSLLLRVPSVIIPEEYNYVLNTQHPEFKNVRIERMEPFLFDPRVAVRAQ